MTTTTFGNLMAGDLFLQENGQSVFQKTGRNVGEALCFPIPCDITGAERPDWVGKDGIAVAITVRPDDTVETFTRVAPQFIDIVRNAL